MPGIISPVVQDPPSPAPQGPAPGTPSANGGAPTPPVRASNDTPPAPAALPGPPRGGDRLSTWVALLACLLLVCPILLIGLAAPHATDAFEARTIATSVQTWRHHGEMTKVPGFSVERYEPYLNGRSQWRRPPGITWLQMGFLDNLAASDSDVHEMVLLARLASVGAALLTIAAVFWAGHSIGGLTTGFLAALGCAACPIFIYQGRVGTATMAGTAASYVAIAAALWAIRPLRRAPSVERQFIGWLMCGVSMGGAIALRGLWGLAEVGVVIVLLLVLCPNRISHLLGLLAALLIAVLIVAPWAVHAHERDAGAWRQWLASSAPAPNWFSAELMWQQGSWRLAMLLAALLPWTLWVFAAAIQPFSTSSSGSRTRLFLGLVWFAALVVMLMAHPGADRLADVSVLLPATAVLVAQLFNRYGALTDEGRSPRFWRLLRWPHLLMLAAASGAIPAMFYAQQTMVERGFPRTFTVNPPQWYVSVGLAIVLLCVVYLSLRWAMKDHPRRSYAAWAVWTLLLVLVLAMPAATRPGAQSDLVDALGGTHDAELFWHHTGDRDLGKVTPHPVVLLYAQRDEVPPVNDALIDGLLAEARPFYLIGPSRPRPVADARVVYKDEHLGLTLWRYDPVEGANVQVDGQ